MMSEFVLLLLSILCHLACVSVYVFVSVCVRFIYHTICSTYKMYDIGMYFYV